MWTQNDWEPSRARLPDGDSQILRSYVFGPSGLKDYGSATLRCKIYHLATLIERRRAGVEWRVTNDASLARRKRVGAKSTQSITPKCTAACHRRGDNLCYIQ